ncbi:hypothetical protein [Sulfuracidifex metallicus]|uniref:Uncharacterized protein n=2 Tax=Sulfuracidifex metallicus TaxID=47303 RepID=A0A6A9QQJ1_SULME|nr:hypothetical protein [Sulfuracidifex metallicus]MUN28083.1 hypothetical protein [Sulfuracidifex metallicus DSM 6482 = JCM 9184]WOE51373.1 hypothetical protein RQ359_000656 [Sulfuracidifex metallicus DSM 6482 = JCM 9184]
MTSGIVRAYVTRLKINIRNMIILSLAYGIGIISSTVIVGVLFPEIYTPTTRQALEALAIRMLNIHNHILPKDALGVIAAAIFTPFLAAIIAAFVASGTISGTFSEGRNEGVFEVLLSSPVSHRDIIISLLIYTLLASLIVEGLVIIITSGISLLSLYLMGYLNSFGIYYLELVTILIPSLTFPAVLISLLLIVISPSLGRVRTGLAPGQNLLSTISLLPVLIPFIVLNIEPQIDPIELASYTSIFSAILALILLILLPRVLKDETLLW